MKKLYLLLLSLSFVILFLDVNTAQSLEQDSKNLVAALKILGGQESCSKDHMIQASAKVIAILHHYDNHLNNTSLTLDSWSAIKSKYSGNQKIEKIFVDSLVCPLADSKVFSSTLKQLDTLRSGGRESIIKKLVPASKISPVDYLSIEKTLEDYRKPLASPSGAMKDAAEKSNQNIKNGIVISQAAIIQGLADFILDRAKDEVIINFIEQWIHGDTPQFSALFPNVTVEFKDLNFKYSSSFMNRLRAAFYEDLQKLSIRLPEFFLSDEYFKPLQGDPIAYNLLVIYSLVGLTQYEEGMPIDEALAATHSFIAENYDESAKKINQRLASDSIYQLPEYIKLLDLSVAMSEQLNTIHRLLIAETSKLLTKYDSNSIVSKIDVEKHLNSLRGDTNYFKLELLPQLIRGEFEEETILRHNTFTSYDRFFSNLDSTKHKLLRAAGLELVQNINGNWYQNRNLATILRNWDGDLIQYTLELERQLVPNSDTLSKIAGRFSEDSTQLVKLIDESEAFWLQNAALSPQQSTALKLLRQLLSKDNFEALAEMAEIDNTVNTLPIQKKTYLLEVKKRFFALDSVIAAKHPQLPSKSPVKEYLKGSKNTDPLQFAAFQIDSLEKLLNKIDQQKLKLDTTFAKAYWKEKVNAKPLLQITEFAANLMYCLRQEGNKDWIKRDSIIKILENDDQEAAFMGLMTQVLSKSNAFGILSVDQLVNLAQATIRDIDFLANSDAESDTLRSFKKASFALNLLNRILELPLFASKKNPNTFQALTKTNKEMAKIPAISEQTLNFIHSLSVKNHPKAISSLIRLFTYFVEAIPTKEKKQDTDKKTKSKEKISNLREPLLKYLNKYGDFIAGLIEADSVQQVRLLLDEIADPPGSSRIKRTSEMTVGINAYLGANLSLERWKYNNSMPDEDKVFKATPHMPVGITLSRLCFKSKQSFSMFLSLLDLGGLFSFAPDSQEDVETELKFRNVLRPGLQVQWNLKKSPFYLGAGWQSGQISSSINGMKSSISLRQCFLGFGIDVPIKTLFQKP